MFQAIRHLLLVLSLTTLHLSSATAFEDALDAHSEPDAPGATGTATIYYERAINLPGNDFEGRIELCREGLALVSPDSTPRDVQLGLHICLGDALLELEKFKESSQHHEFAATLARELGEDGALTISLYNVAFANTNTGDFERAIEAAREAATLAERLDLPEVRVHSLNLVGVSCDRMGDTEGAIRAYAEALEIVADSGNATVSYQLLSNLSVLNMNAGNLDEALDFFERGLMIVTEAQDPVSIASTVANIGDVHFLAGRFDLSLERHQHALQLRKELNREGDYALSLSRIGDVYIELDELELAIEHLERARDIQIKLGQQPEIIATLGRLSRAYTALDRGLDAVRVAQAGNDLANAIQTKALHVIALQDLASAYEANGQLAEALTTARKAFALDHEVNSLESTRSIAELNKNVENRLSEIVQNGEIIELERMAALSKAKLERQSLQRNFLIAGGVLILVIALVGWSSYLFKRRANEALKVSHDATKRLLEAQKLESLGLLSGGVAHDFNNFLAVISGNSELARLASKDDEVVNAHLDDIQTACRRATEVAQQMLCYSGEEEPQREFVDFVEIARDTVSLLQTTTTSQIQFAFESEPNLPKVFGDKTQLGQVVMNLITNAVEAIGDHAGEVKTRLALIEVGNESAIEHQVAKGTYVKLEVADTGEGIEEDRIPKLFDPFFTGKAEGHGLGLATIQGVLRRHGGAISVKSVLGAGSSFTVLLSSAAPTSVVDLEHPIPSLSSAKLKLGTALVIDDDEEVLKTTGRMLSVLNWESVLVSQAQSGIDAIRDQFDVNLLILDLVMPNTDITRTLATIKTLRPELPVLLISGFDRHGLVSDLTKDPSVRFLAKPFGIKQLSDYLPESIDSSPKDADLAQDVLS